MPRSFFLDVKRGNLPVDAFLHSGRSSRSGESPRQIGSEFVCFSVFGNDANHSLTHHPSLHRLGWAMLTTGQ